MDSSVNSWLVAQFAQDRIAEATAAKQRSEARSARRPSSRRTGRFARRRPSISAAPVVASFAPRIQDEPRP